MKFFVTALASLVALLALASQGQAAAIADPACQHFCLPGETGCCIPPPKA